MPDYNAMPVSDGDEMTFMATLPVEMGQSIVDLAALYEISPSLLVMYCIESALAPERRYDVAGRVFGLHLGLMALRKERAEEADNPPPEG